MANHKQTRAVHLAPDNRAVRGHEVIEQNYFADPFEEVASQRRYSTYQRRKAERERRKKIRRKVRIITAVLLVILIAAAVILLRSCTANAQLNGKWIIDTTTGFEFYSDGTGAMTLPSAKYSFTYSVKDHVLSIDFEDENATDRTYSYEIHGKTMKWTELSPTSGIYELTSVD